MPPPAADTHTHIKHTHTHTETNISGNQPFQLVWQEFMSHLLYCIVEDYLTQAVTEELFTERFTITINNI